MRARRPTRAEWAMMLAMVTATRGTCTRRQVGCVLLNNRGHVLSTGYNGPAAGTPHCIDNPCIGSSFKSGTGLEACEAIHAEQNALLQCPDIYSIKTCCVTTSPCIHCVKLLMNTSCQEIFFLESYPGSQQSQKLWLSTNNSNKIGSRQRDRIWTRMDLSGSLFDAVVRPS